MSLIICQLHGNKDASAVSGDDPDLATPQELDFCWRGESSWKARSGLGVEHMHIEIMGILQIREYGLLSVVL